MNPLDAATDAAYIVRAYGQDTAEMHETTPESLALTNRLVTEELSELCVAVAQHDLVETADALIDIAYVTAGSMVRHRLPVFPITVPDDIAVPTADIALAAGVYLSSLAQGVRGQLIGGESPQQVGHAGSALIALCQVAMERLGLDFGAMWAEVHSSNISKLVDGEAVRDSTGKVTKPDTYRPANLAPLIDNTDRGQWWVTLTTG